MLIIFINFHNICPLTMSTLKFKIARVLQMRDIHPEILKTKQKEETLPAPKPIQSRLRTRTLQPHPPTTATPKGSTSCKNIMKNYSRVLTMFALSPLALHYLLPLLQKNQL